VGFVRLLYNPRPTHLPCYRLNWKAKEAVKCVQRFLRERSCGKTPKVVARRDLVGWPTTAKAVVYTSAKPSTRPSSALQLSARLYCNSEVAQFECLVGTRRNHYPLVFHHAVIARLR
jgi:hypothetical protein